MLKNKFMKVKDLLRPIYYRLKVEPHYSIYKSNEILVNFVYGKLQTITISSIKNNVNQFIINNYKNKPTKFMNLSQLNIDNLLISELDKGQVEKLDQITTLYEMSHDFNRVVHDNLASEVRKYCKSPYTIVNTRMWTTAPGSESFGPNALHTDGFYPSHFKVMIYPFGMNEDNGYLVVRDEIISDMPPGSVVMFRNSDVLHSGVAGKLNERLVIELAVLRTFFHLPQYHVGHPNGRHYKNFFLVLLTYMKKNGFLIILYKLLGNDLKSYFNRIKLNLVSKINSKLIIKKINLGSGKKCWVGWRCFDALEYKTVETLRFSENSRLPDNVDNIELFYSSHNLEHLNDETVDNLIQQIYQKLAKSGNFLLKMPDFEFILNAYRNGTLTEINDTGVLDTLHTWCNKNVLPTIENKISMVFCGYMNKAYGNHFESERKVLDSPYHGPSLMSHDNLEHILKNESIRNISKILNAQAILDEDFGQFNHQNAWSRSDIKLMLASHGFRVISEDKNEISRKFRYVVPDIDTSFDSSMYLLFKKI